MRSGDHGATIAARTSGATRPESPARGGLPWLVTAVLVVAAGVVILLVVVLSGGYPPDLGSARAYASGASKKVNVLLAKENETWCLLGISGWASRQVTRHGHGRSPKIGNGMHTIMGNRPSPVPTVD